MPDARRGCGRALMTPMGQKPGKEGPDVYVDEHPEVVSDSAQVGLEQND